jgi:ubiquinone/menaquinone biosynthesis C-methylase UbiE
MVAAQQFGRQKLERRPEPSQTTEATANILQYDRVMSTKLSLAYAAGLQFIHRARPDGPMGTAIDLACGPGHFTLCLARYLGYDRVLGVDLAAGMVETGTKNAQNQNLSPQVTFRKADATSLQDVPDSEYMLATFTDAAHHMPDLATVASVLQEMERITKPEGLVMVMDLVRLRTASLTERYVRVLGRDYIERGLPEFFEDFKNSMYAAWTPSEMASAVPPNSRRRWVHIVPRLLPTVQVLLGLPMGCERTFLRNGLLWARREGPISRENRGDWAMLQASLKMAPNHVIVPQSGN